MTDLRRRLALSFPDGDGRATKELTVDHLILCAIAEVVRRAPETAIRTATDVCSALQDALSLTYGENEIVPSLERHAAAGRIAFRGDSHKAFVVNPDALTPVEQQSNELKIQKSIVRDSWIAELRTRHTLSDDDATALWDALEEFLSRIVDRSAAEAASFLYGSEHSARERFIEALNSAAPDIGESLSPELRDLGKQEIPRFLTSTNDADRRRYLAETLRAAFFFYLLSIDPGASALIMDRLQGKTLYLDTNVIFRLVGFHGPSMENVAKAIVSAAQSLGCRLVVAEETVREYQRTLSGEGEELKLIPNRRSIYLAVAARHDSFAGSFAAKYQQEVLAGLVQDVRQFVRKYSLLKDLLQPFGITIESSAILTEKERTSEEFRDLVGRYSMWKASGKGQGTLEHDVFLLRHVEKLRDGRSAGFADTPFWALTHDRRLTGFTVTLANADDSQTCMLAEDFLQIAQAFLPRTLDYSESLAAILQNPAFAPANSTVSFDYMVNAMQRVDRIANLTEGHVVALLANEQFVHDVQRLSKDDEILDLVESELAKQAGKLEEDLAMAKASLATANEGSEEKSEQLKQISRELEVEKAARQQLEEAVRRNEARAASGRAMSKSAWVLVLTLAVFGGAGYAMKDAWRMLHRSPAEIPLLLLLPTVLFASVLVSRIRAKEQPRPVGRLFDAADWVSSRLRVLLGLIALELVVTGLSAYGASVGKSAAAALGDTGVVDSAKSNLKPTTSLPQVRDSAGHHNAGTSLDSTSASSTGTDSASGAMKK